MSDDADEGIRGPLARSKERVAARLHRAGQLMPHWLALELEALGRACFARGERHVHTKRTNPNPASPFDDEPTPVRDLFKR